jgi:lysophospholipase L1-like esterase
MTRILVVGHSFIARYRRYLNRKALAGPGIQHDFAQEFGLPNECVFVTGQGGLKTDETGKTFILNAVNTVKPALVVLEIGTNDISDSNVGSSNTNGSIARRVSSSIVELCRCLKEDLNVETVVFCQVVNRRRFRGDVSPTDFEIRRKAVNKRLQEQARRRPYIYVFNHDRRCIVNLREEVTGDDIHVTTDAAMRLYHFSIRRAITRGLQHTSMVH